MKPFYESAGTTLYLGDCVEVMRELPECSIDAVVTDPPYGLHFMGKSWDKFGGPLGTDHKNGRKRSGSMHAGEYDFSRNHEFQRHMTVWAREVLRVLKPGGHLLAFGGARTYHRVACAIEDAGFEIRDCLQWLYGSGFPKSKNMKDIDRPELGTALKPSHEPVVMARKPLSESSVARNVLEHGTGAINIDGCRVGVERRTNGDMSNLGVMHDDDWISDKSVKSEVSGRWPANLILSHAPECERVGVKRVRSGDSKASESTLSAVKGGLGGKISAHYADPDGMEEVESFECAPGCPVAELDRQSGTLKSGSRSAGVRKGLGYHGANGDGGPGIASSEGGASRFFSNFSPDVGPGYLYCAKASRSERTCNGTVECGHPTVKPLALMRWLVRLVTPPGGLVLDPFAGSGTTGLAAIAEGFRAILIEREEKYANICRARLEHGVREPEPAPVRRPAKLPATSPGAEQLELDWESA